MIKRTVQIGSEEFKKAVLDILQGVKIPINDIEDPRYERLADGWIKDHELGLDWGPISSDSMNYGKAKDYCKSLGGRLPTVDELQTILDRTLHNPACDKKIFKDVKSEWYWASDKYTGTSNAFWCVSFYYGFVNGDYEDSSYYVRPVRSSQ